MFFYQKCLHANTGGTLRKNSQIYALYINLHGKLEIGRYSFSKRSNALASLFRTLREYLGYALSSESPPGSTTFYSQKLNGSISGDYLAEPTTWTPTFSTEDRLFEHFWKEESTLSIS